MFFRISMVLFAVCLVVPLRVAHQSGSKAIQTASTRCDANQASLNACAERKLQHAEMLMNKAGVVVEISRGRLPICHIGSHA